MNDFSNIRYEDTIPRSQKVVRAFWLLVWALFFRFSPRGFGNSWRLFLLRTFGAQIGRGSKVSSTCFVWAPWNLKMGDYSVLGDGVDCYTMNTITLGSKVAVSQRAFLCTGTHDISSLKRPLITLPIVIEDHVWIAAEAMVMPGVTVAEGSVIGAKSLVTKNMPAWSVCSGVPCNVIGPRVIRTPPEGHTK